MDAIRTKKLFQRYPLFLRGRSHGLSTNLMGFGFECGSGWYSLLNQVFAVAEKECQTLRRRGVALNDLPIAVQVKEKFGQLRIYVHASSDAVYKAIEDAEAASAYVCEQCGRPSKMSESGWMSTVCASCKANNARATEVEKAIQQRRKEKATRLAEALVQSYSAQTHILNKQQRAAALIAVFSGYAPELQVAVEKALLDSPRPSDRAEVSAVYRSVKKKPTGRSSTYYLRKLRAVLKAARRAGATL